MIDYETFCKIKLFGKQGLNANQIARELTLDEKTVAKWMDQEKYKRRETQKRPSKLDAHKSRIVASLAEHDYTATQLFQRLREEGYTGGFSILKEFVRTARPSKPAPAFLTLHFAPGECAQVDWGSFGSIDVGTTRRKLSFFLMVLAHSRMLYVEFTPSQSLEHFLGAHQNALNFFGGVPRRIMIDNLKTGVLSHPVGQKAVFHPRYLDFAAHHGFEPVACNVRKANEKGRVENGIGYVKKNFLSGLTLSSLSALNTAARQWMDTIANVRVHGETRQQPKELFKVEEPALQRLSALPGDTSITRLVRATNRCRVVLESNRYSVPSSHAGARLLLKASQDRICIYHDQKLIATHTRCYDRGADFENPDHIRDLLDQRKNAQDARLVLAFLALSPRAEEYRQQLGQRRLNAQHHIRKIVALSEIYGKDKVARAIDDAFVSSAFSSEYITNILEQRERIHLVPGALHITRNQDLLDLEIPAADLSIYNQDR